MRYTIGRRKLATEPLGSYLCTGCISLIMKSSYQSYDFTSTYRYYTVSWLLENFS